ncbi:hypothetical protein F2N28_27535 [Escherichia coli]|nr:hypothetical protein [Escherichia coli]EFE8014499.1 hypothetical protein [Escherichia coli]
MDTRKSPLYAGFFVPEKRYRTLNALVVANTGLSACWLFRQELLVCHVNQKRENTPLVRGHVCITEETYLVNIKSCASIFVC